VTGNAAMLPEVGSDLPGVRNAGLLATQELAHGVLERADWEAACRASTPLLTLAGQRLVERLGFRVETLSTAASVLTAHDAKRAVAVFLDESETFEDPSARFGATPVSHGLALADREGLPWLVVTRGKQIRLYTARPDTGVGRRGRAATFVELNLALLPADSCGYLVLLFGGDALSQGGSLEHILERSAEFAAALGSRLRDRVYFETVPQLSQAIAARLPVGAASETDLVHAYEQTLMVLFRLLFMAYGEDKDLLPYRTNGRYNDHSLKRLARRLSESRRRNELFDSRATDLWDDVRTLWDAVQGGNTGGGVPAYDGGLFSSDPAVNRAGADLAGLALTDTEFGPALRALLVDEGADSVVGPVDFRSLSVREFGTLYEGLLESRLSLAENDLTVDDKGSYVPAKVGQTVLVPAGTIYFHNRSGSRKASGSYFTKPFAVEHLLDHALEPALADHVARLNDLIVGDEAGAAKAFFDFRCADLAMGSGHFLVAAVDRIEARLSGFLALHPIPQVLAELEELRGAAFDALGDLADGVEIETSSLLRRQVARRCVYGVDRNDMAVELARLAMWIHTFVPGLPLSFLSHGLVRGDSLAGIGTLDEALEVLDPQGHPGRDPLFRDEIRSSLAKAETALSRLALAVEKTTRDVDASRAAQRDALAAVEPARQLFDILVAARLGRTAVPVDVSEAAIAQHPGIQTAADLAAELGPLHFPVAFPEVFLRPSPGFDCILGNPPWEEATVERLGFWTLRHPGLKGMRQAQQNAEIARLQQSRPDLVAEYDAEKKRTDALRELLLTGPYPGMGTGDPDLYKAFCWRFWHLARNGGAIGVVLPRSALSAAGSAPWRQAVLEEGAFADVTMTLNTAGWVFDDAEHRYTIGFVSLRKGGRHAGLIHLSGPYSSLNAYIAGRGRKPAELSVQDFRSWSEGVSFPLVPTEESLGVFLKLRRCPSIGTRQPGWSARPVREFDATNDKRFFVFGERQQESMWPVYKGASFNIWQPDTGVYYAWADSSVIKSELQRKRLRQQELARSAFSEFSRMWSQDPVTLPCIRPRVAFRDVARATDSRTVISALVPPDIVITNQAPYLLWPQGDERDEAYLLGVLCSIPLDWYARRFVEMHLNFHVFNGFPIPRPERDDPLRLRVEHIAGLLAAVDERYEGWAAAVGVPVGGVRDDREDLIAELDAAVALLYGLDANDVRHIFETFHEGWQFGARLEAVLRHHAKLNQ
jgi:hypothetical protein